MHLIESGFSIASSSVAAITETVFYLISHTALHRLNIMEADAVGLFQLGTIINMNKGGCGGGRRANTLFYSYLEGICFFYCCKRQTRGTHKSERWREKARQREYVKSELRGLEE